MHLRLLALSLALIVAGLGGAAYLSEDDSAQVVSTLSADALPTQPLAEEMVLLRESSQQAAAEAVARERARQEKARALAAAAAEVERVEAERRKARASRSAARTAPQEQAVSGLPAILIRIRGCESGHDYRAENPTSTASGAYQFLAGTWRSVTGLKPPASAYSKAVQDRAALTLYRSAGTRPWNASKACWG